MSQFQRGDTVLCTQTCRGQNVTVGDTGKVRCLDGINDCLIRIESIPGHDKVTWRDESMLPASHFEHWTPPQQQSYCHPFHWGGICFITRGISAQVRVPRVPHHADR